MEPHEIEEIAREEAYSLEPTENGIFDGLVRAEHFATACYKRGYIPWIGFTPLLDDEQIEELLRTFKLDER